MTSALVTAKWSLEEYHRMIEAGILSDRRVELLQGEIVEMAPEGEPHAHLSSDAADYIREVLRGQVKVREEKPITLPDASEPEPDIAVVQNLGDIYLEHHPYPENIFWVIEYADSSLTKDLEFKRQIYAEAGIREYWVINLKRMELVVFSEIIAGCYQRKKTLTNGNISPTAFPETALAVNRFIRR
ncbi:MAG: Uma2 family endonuclease [Cyanobacteria bacterium P01_F01_bin.86]